MYDDWRVTHVMVDVIDCLGERGVEKIKGWSGSFLLVSVVGEW